MITRILDVVLGPHTITLTIGLVIGMFVGDDIGRGSQKAWSSIEDGLKSYEVELWYLERPLVLDAYDVQLYGVEWTMVCGKLTSNDNHLIAHGGAVVADLVENAP